MRSRSYFCMTLCSSAEVTFKNNFESLEVDGYYVSLGVFISFSSHSGGGDSVGSAIGRPSQ